ncbi:fimbrial protein [Caballeronia sp. KNU42]
MTVPNRTGKQLRIDGMSVKAQAIKIGRQLRAWILTSLFAIFLGALFVSPVSAAITCTPGNVGKVLSAGTIVVPMNAPSGTVVSTVAPASFQMRCSFMNSSPFNTTGTATLQLTVTAALAPGFADVYKTAIDGLGVRFVFNAPTCNATNLSLNNSLLRIPCDISGPLGGPYQDTNVTVTTIFVTYGAVKGGATTLSSIPVLDEGFEASDNPGKIWSQTPVYTGSATGTLNTATCSVQTQDLAVFLPTPAVRAFAAGVGAVAGRTAFHLDFTCSTGAQVSIVITDAVTPANRSNVLTLSPESTVKGIGVQVLKGDGTPVAFGPDAVGVSVENQWLIGASPNGVLVLPLSAQYIRTGSVTPGSLKALATFTMSYN